MSPAEPHVPLNIVILGPPGAGKGTQGKLIARDAGIPHINTGDIFRAECAAGTELGQKVNSVIDAGDLVPDELTTEIVRARLAQDDTARGFVLDGFPRTVFQAEQLERVLVHQPLDVVIDLDVPTEIVLHRIAGRRVCMQCQTVYHIDNPPKENWTCDVCGGYVDQRDDDTEEAVMRRLELYETQTLPLIHFYRRRGLLAHVDGTGDSDEVFEGLVATIEARVRRDSA
jgi:adenylate kinase